MVLISRDYRLRGVLVDSYVQHKKRWYVGETSDGVRFMGTVSHLILVCTCEEYEKIEMGQIKKLLQKRGGESDGSLSIRSNARK